MIELTRAARLRLAWMDYYRQEGSNAALTRRRFWISRQTLSHEGGLVQVREIRDLPLNAELVTLSACDTGQGRLLGEEGIANLEEAFLLAGAKAVIASLWGADDTYTLALMKLSTAI